MKFVNGLVVNEANVLHLLAHLWYLQVPKSVLRFEISANEKLLVATMIGVALFNFAKKDTRL